MDIIVSSLCIISTVTHSAVSGTAPGARVAGCSAAVAGCSATGAGCSANVARSSATVVGCSASVGRCCAAVTGCNATVVGCRVTVSRSWRATHRARLLHYKRWTGRLGLRCVAGHQTNGRLLRVVCATKGNIPLLIIFCSPTILRNSINNYTS